MGSENEMLKGYIFNLEKQMAAMSIEIKRNVENTLVVKTKKKECNNDEEIKWVSSYPDDNIFLVDTGVHKDHKVVEHKVVTMQDSGVKRSGTRKELKKMRKINSPFRRFERTISMRFGRSKDESKIEDVERVYTSNSSVYNNGSMSSSNNCSPRKKENRSLSPFSWSRKKTNKVVRSDVLQLETNQDVILKDEVVIRDTNRDTL